jgi:hypothetical protein
MTFLDLKKFVENLNHENLLLLKKIIENQIVITIMKKDIKENENLLDEKIKQEINEGN